MLLIGAVLIQLNFRFWVHVFPDVVMFLCCGIGSLPSAVVVVEVVALTTRVFFFSIFAPALISALGIHTSLVFTASTCLCGAEVEDFEPSNRQQNSPQFMTIMLTTELASEGSSNRLMTTKTSCPDRQSRNIREKVESPT